MKDGSHLSDSQALILLKSHEPVPEPAGTYERWVFAVPMFLLFIIIGGTSFAVEYYGGDTLRSEMGATFATSAVLAWHEIMVVYPWMFPAGMFLLTWLYFAVICRRRESARWVGRIMALLAFVVFFVAMIGIMLPISHFKLLG